MTYKYRTRGVCSRSITFDMDENHIITNISFEVVAMEIQRVLLLLLKV